MKELGSLTPPEYIVPTCLQDSCHSIRMTVGIVQFGRTDHTDTSCVNQSDSCHHSPIRCANLHLTKHHTTTRVSIPNLNSVLNFKK